MTIKRVLCPARVRRIPRQFSWVDRRLVRHDLLRACGVDALALYLFLLTVADAQGLSYYADRSIMRKVGLDAPRLARARDRLEQVGLTAYQPPLYQVLALDALEHPPQPTEPLARPRPAGPGTVPRHGQPVVISELLRQALEARHDPL